MNDKTFHLAITMAGAISAGAYTAGVMDYLLETLDKWEKMKSDDNYKDKLPTHNIQIDIISGASAGGMTACMSSLVLFEKERQHVNHDTSEEKREKNRLYNAWINLPYNGKKLNDFKAADVLLSDDDVVAIENFNNSLPSQNKKVIFPVSVLNSLIVRKIADKTIDLSKKEKAEFSLKNRAVYVAEDLDIFVTLTNLKGFQSKIPFQSSDKTYVAEYISTDHRDLMMFNIGCKKPGNINIDFTGDSEEAIESIKLLKNAAVSTGAFPIGLEYGFIERKTEYINKNILLRKIHSPVIGNNIINNDLTKYSAAMIDGGLIDNEPFELTDFLIKERLGKGCQKKCTMLMIDPFPSKGLETDTDNIFIDEMHRTYPYSFWGAIAQLITTARSQLISKAANKRNYDKEFLLLKSAIENDDTSCFLISPRRRNGNGKVIEGSEAIACGTLGGFGGFIHSDFREHDFFLGRANCKSFLLKHFKFDADLLNDKESPFFESYNAAAKEAFVIVDNNGKEFYPIIPDVDLLKRCENKEKPDYEQEKKEWIDEIYAENKFPEISAENFDKFYDSITPLLKKRLKLILGTFIPKWLMIILKPINYFLIKYGLAALKEKIILKDLKRNGIIEEKSS